MDAAKRTAVRLRADDRCEYCQRQQADSPLIALHVEHIIPIKHGGSDNPENLALACAECNLHKGTNLTGIDPESSQITPLFDPRRDRRGEHFIWDGLQIVGLTSMAGPRFESLCSTLQRACASDWQRAPNRNKVRIEISH